MAIALLCFIFAVAVVSGSYIVHLHAIIDRGRTETFRLQVRLRDYEAYPPGFLPAHLRPDSGPDRLPDPVPTPPRAFVMKPTAPLSAFERSL